MCFKHSIIISTGADDINGEASRMFSGTKPATSSCSETTSKSLITRASRLIRELHSDPLSVTERHTRRKRPHTKIKNAREYQRNLVVIDYVENPPSVQVLRDYDRVYDGPLRFTSCMSEDEIREEIASLLSMKKDSFHNFEWLCCEDFQFVKCANRRVRVPDGGSDFNGETLKTMFKSGSIYVRLTRSFSTNKVREFT